MSNITIENIDASFQEAFAHHQQGEIELAKRIYEAILLVEPNHFNALHMLGVAITDENPSVAVAMISKAIEIDPTFVECFNNAANALIKMEQYSLAIDCCNQAISLKGDYWEAYANRGEALRNLQRWTEALISYDLAIDFKKDEARLYSNRGNVYGELGRLEEGLTDLNQSVLLDPNNPEAYLNRGNIHQELGQLELAKQDYTKAIELAPNLADAHFNLSLLLLLEGNLEEGWAKYDWRWKRKKLDSDPLISEKPKWQKGNKHDRVLVWAEQGVGDHVFFGSLLPEMKQLVPNLLVQIDQRLIPLFKRSMPEIAFYPSNQPVDESKYDAHLPMGDLGGIFRSKKEDFANRKDAFLVVDKERASKIRQSLCKDGETLIGISWKSKNKQSGLKRSLELKDFAEKLSAPSVKLVNLQYGDVKEELEQLKREHGIEILQCAGVDNTNDLDGLAALIEACDKVESVDNTTVHLGGAVGKATVVHLNGRKNWRWMPQVNNNLWYSDVSICDLNIPDQEILRKITQKIQIQSNRTDLDNVNTTVFCAVWSGDQNRHQLLKEHYLNLKKQSVPVKIVYVFDNGDKPLIDMDAITLIINKALTIYEAWNIAIATCQTKYIMNLNLDDRLNSDAISLLEQAMTTTGADLVGGDWKICYSQEQTDKVSHCAPISELNFLPGWPPITNSSTRLGSGSGERATYGPATLWKLDNHLSIPRYPYRIDDGSPIKSIGDSLWWESLKIFNKKLLRVPFVIGNYHSHPESQAEFRVQDEWKLIENKKVMFI